jgi:hypothetical protein
MLIFLVHPNVHLLIAGFSEAEFLDEKLTKVLRVFLLAISSTALPWDFYFFKLKQPLVVSVKEKRGKPYPSHSCVPLPSMLCKNTVVVHLQNGSAANKVIHYRSPGIEYAIHKNHSKFLHKYASQILVCFWRSWAVGTLSHQSWKTETTFHNCWRVKVTVNWFNWNLPPHAMQLTDWPLVQVALLLIGLTKIS